jgi:hypothetical protein
MLTDHGCKMMGQAAAMVVQIAKSDCNIFRLRHYRDLFSNTSEIGVQLQLIPYDSYRDAVFTTARTHVQHSTMESG